MGSILLEPSYTGIVAALRIRESRANAKAAGVQARIQFLEQDLFTADISQATVVVLFLWPDLNLKLRPTLWRDLRPGTRVVSYVHGLTG